MDTETKIPVIERRLDVLENEVVLLFKLILCRVEYQNK